MKLPSTYFPNPNPTKVGEELYPTIENQVTVKITELCFSDRFNTFALRAPVERTISSDGNEMFKLDELKLIYTRPKLDAKGKEITKVCPETGEELVVTEDVPYKHLVKGRVEINFGINPENGVVSAQLTHNSSKEVNLLGFNIDASRTNKCLSPAERMCRGMRSMHPREIPTIDFLKNGGLFLK